MNNDYKYKSERSITFSRNKIFFVFIISFALTSFLLEISLSSTIVDIGKVVIHEIEKDKEEEVNNVLQTDILKTIIFIIVVAIFLIIIFYLGGVFEKKSIPFDKISGIIQQFLSYVPLLIYIGLIMVIFVLPLLQKFGYIRIFPDDPDEILKRKEFESFRQVRLPYGICLFFKYLNVSEAISCYVPAFIYFFLLPVTAIYTIVWAFLKQINVFEKVEKKLESLIAFLITFMSLPLGSLTLLVAISFSMIGFLSIIVFVSMLLLGIFSTGFVKASKSYQNIIKEVQKISQSIQLRQDNILAAAKLYMERILEATDKDKIIDELENFERSSGLKISAKDKYAIKKSEEDLNKIKERAINLIYEASEGHLPTKKRRELEEVKRTYVDTLKQQQKQQGAQAQGGKK